ncbi:heterokaryon incompatibility protein-domain-containing protein [Xylaria longipes]|nr:heterokaryon incompatibility protein-domain-containing protein [Xylaria longipes]
MRRDRFLFPAARVKPVNCGRRSLPAPLPLLPPPNRVLPQDLAMRLINVKTLKLEEFLDYEAPPYAILSHTWGDDREELTLAEVQDGRIDKPGAGSVKFRGSCRQAEEDGLGYVWIDTCCIDKANAVELGEAINSMFRWYRGASVCYAYLSDVPSNDIRRDHASKFRASRWFRRGWTLQELLAPKSLRFYDSEWCTIGTKGRLWAVLGEITGVPRQFLLGIAELHAASVAQRMAWAAQRDTKRKEDLAYCLLGIFDVTMPMIYGEGGDQAFFRLQEQIMKKTRDDSILAWNLGVENEYPGDESVQVIPGRILAAAPSDFAHSGQIISRHQPTTSLNPFDISSGSLRMHLPLLHSPLEKFLGLLSCGPEHNPQQVVGIPLYEVTSGSPGEYFRPKGHHSVLTQSTTPNTLSRLIHIKNDSPATKSESENQLYWLYDDEEFAELNLDLVDVLPRSCWHQDQAMIVSTTTTPNCPSHPIIVRLRHSESMSTDFLMVLELVQQKICIEGQCSVMVCSRLTQLEELAGKLQHVVGKLVLRPRAL